MRHSGIGQPVFFFQYLDPFVDCTSEQRYPFPDRVLIRYLPDVSKYILFDGAAPAFDKRIIPGLASPVHTDPDLMLFEGFAPVRAVVLTALIRIENLRGSIPGNSLGYQLGLCFFSHTVRHLPTDDVAAIQVNNSG